LTAFHSATALRARLAPVLEALGAAGREAMLANRFPAEVHRALVEAGLWKLWVPREFGGLEQDLPASLALFEEAASADGSLGFALAIGTGGGLFAAWLPEQTARRIFLPAEALIAGSGAPGGTARPAGDGYRVEGHWRWASLVHQATWVTGSVLPAQGGAPFAIAVPAQEVRIEPAWDTHALAATGSHDVRMDSVFVPRSQVFDLSAPPRLDRPLYRFDFMALAASAFAAVAAGIARGALQRRLAAPAPGRGGDAAAARLARAAGQQRAAWQLLRGEVGVAWEALHSRPASGPETLHALHLAAVTATRLSVAAVELLAEDAGMRLLDRADPFSRAWRDVHAVAQHSLVSVSRESDLGAQLRTSGACDQA
jgi:indole-3-acetate monooxygenase